MSSPDLLGVPEAAQRLLGDGGRRAAWRGVQHLHLDAHARLPASSRQSWQPLCPSCLTLQMGMQLFARSRKGHTPPPWPAFCPAARRPTRPARQPEAGPHRCMHVLHCSSCMVRSTWLAGSTTTVSCAPTSARWSALAAGCDQAQPSWLCTTCPGVCLDR